MAFEGFLGPGVVFKPARDPVPESITIAGSDAAGQHRRQPIIAGLARFDEQAPFLQAFKITCCRTDPDATKQPGVDARGHRCDGKYPPGRSGFIGQQVLGESVP